MFDELARTDRLVLDDRERGRSAAPEVACGGDLAAGRREEAVEAEEDAEAVGGKLFANVKV